MKRSGKMTLKRSDLSSTADARQKPRASVRRAHQQAFRAVDLGGDIRVKNN